MEPTKTHHDEPDLALIASPVVKRSVLDAQETQLNALKQQLGLNAATNDN